VTSASDLELGFYEHFLLAKGLEPYPVEEQAIGRIVAGKSVLVMVPTGTGKTVVPAAEPGAASASWCRA
jgi:Lhr-like helicase